MLFCVYIYYGNGYGITEEFIILIIFLAMAVVCYGLFLLVLPTGSNIRLVVSNIASAIGCYVISMISTYWVIQQYYKQLDKNIEEQTSMDEDIIANRRTLEEILSTKDGFDLFAHHLVKEFSIENLAFIFEVMKIKKDAINNGLSA